MPHYFFSLKIQFIIPMSLPVPFEAHLGSTLSDCKGRAFPQIGQHRMFSAVSAWSGLLTISRDHPDERENERFFGLHLDHYRLELFFPVLRASFLRARVTEMRSGVIPEKECFIFLCLVFIFYVFGERERGSLIFRLFLPF